MAMWYSDAATVELCLFGQAVSVAQNNTTMHVGTTVWEASLVFAKWVERNALGAEWQEKKHPLSRHALADKRVVELGAGCGVAAMAMALLGCDTLATDIQAVLPILKKNIKRNMTTLSPTYTAAMGAPGRLKPAQLHWGVAKQIAAVKPPFDVVVVTDCVYVEEGVEPLIRTMREVSGPHTVLCLGYRLRQQEAHDLFWEELPKGFEIETVDRREMHPEYAFDDVSLYILKKRRD